MLVPSQGADVADIFISYKSERRPAARHLKKVLETYFRITAEDCVWYDYGLIPGDDFEPRIMAEIEQAKVVVVLWCTMSVKSDWVLKEALEAKRTGKFLPIRIESCSLPNAFAGADTINLSEWDASPRSPMLDRLLVDIGRRLGREGAARIPRLRELEEDWHGYGRPSLAHFALGKALEPDAVQIAPQALPKPVLGSPPTGISENLARHWDNALRGDVGALAWVAWHLIDGADGAPRNEAEAARLYKLAAAQGNALAQRGLGYMYSEGLGGIPKNQVEAVRLYRLAAEQGDAGGQRNLGAAYAMGAGGLPKDEIEALRLFRLAADQGDALGQANLGNMYLQGFGGLTPDHMEALRLFRSAADQGDALAFAHLGNMYLNGLGGLPRDEREALRLVRLSVEKGNTWGQAYLGYMYANAFGGLTQDNREAVRLYKLAAARGDQWARDELRRLGESW